MATGRPDAEAVPVEVTCRGQVPQSTVDYARTKVEHVVRFAHEPVLNAHVVLTVAPDPAVERWARGGVPERQRLSSPGARDHVRHARIGGPARGQAAEDPGTRRPHPHPAPLDRCGHGSRVATRRPPHPTRGPLPEASDERDVVRRKTFLEPMTPDEAAFDMDMLGHDFYLFTDLRSGKDAIVYHTATAGSQFGARWCRKERPPPW